MKRTLFVLVAVTVLVSFVSLAQNAPKFQVDPMWPKPLPNHWILGSVTGVVVDSKDHVWIVHQGASTLTTNTEMGTGTTPPTAEGCCIAAPPVLEFDAAGTLLSHWGGPGEGYQWPRCVVGLAVDGKGNVFVGGNAPAVGQRGARSCTGGVAGLNTDPDNVPAAGARGGGAG